jgi:xanthine permease XanP
LLNIRRTFAVGIALIFGLSVELVPGLFSHVPSVIAPVFSSALSLTTVLVFGLNLLFRIGVAKHRRAELIPDGRGSLYEITQLLLEQGAAWGMRTGVAMHATTPVRLELRFDEFNLEADIHYGGEPIELRSAPPSMEAFGSSAGSAAGIIASYLVYQLADRVSIRSADGHCHVHLHFEPLST